MLTLTAIILAAGKGTRMKAMGRNKVAIEIKGEPMLTRTIKILRGAGVGHIVVVVGHQKESVTGLLDKDIVIAEQKKRLGTGHAVAVALSQVPKDTEDVLIIYGDDAFMHLPETFSKLYEIHKKENAKISFITMDSDNPTGFGRIIRDSGNKIIGIVEEKNATEEQKKIKEINLGCYIINKKYLEENIRKIKKNPLTGEYYITDIIDIISHLGGHITSCKLLNGKWRGVNTKEDLVEAENLFSH